MPVLRVMLAILLLVVSLPTGLARAAQDMRDAVRLTLVDAGWHGDARLAAVIVRLAKGWKTYWRLPGEGGVPPRFDFSGSGNVRQVKVLWPAPKRFVDPVTGETIGFKDMAVFPLLITPENPDKPVHLRLKLDYGICGQMCVPVRAERQLTLPVQARPDDATRKLVRQWLAKTPLLNDTADVQVRAARLLKDEANDGLALEITLAGAQAAQVEDMFVEGVDLAVFGQPRRIKEAKDAVTFRIPVRGLAKEKDFTGATLRLTIVLQGERALKRTLRLP